MRGKSRFWLPGAVVVLAMYLGCASAYHSYPSGSCIPYGYCPEPPLPYATYESAHCPTSVGSEWRSRHGPAGVKPSADDLKTPDDVTP
jgi:hypothetical protein